MVRPKRESQLIIGQNRVSFKITLQTKVDCLDFLVHHRDNSDENYTDTCNFARGSISLVILLLLPKREIRLTSRISYPIKSLNLS